MQTVALVAMGHAPRPDITDDIVARLPEDIEVTEWGALNRYATADAAETAIGAEEDGPVIVTTLRDGTTVHVDKRGVAREIQTVVAEQVDDVDAVGLLCTGQFPRFDCPVSVLEAGALLRSWADAIAPDGTLGVLMPEPEQARQVRAEWPEGRAIRTVAASPYGDAADVRAAARDLRGVDLVLLKCMGYDYETKRAVRETTGVGTLLPRSLLTKAITELLGRGQ
jgi:protein AroM